MNGIRNEKLCFSTELLIYVAVIPGNMLDEGFPNEEVPSLEAD